MDRLFGLYIQFRVNPRQRKSIKIVLGGCIFARFYKTFLGFYVDNVG